MFLYLTAGESHGPALVGILDGLPAHLQLDVERINETLRRRQGGYGRGARMKIESDEVEFLAGVRGAKPRLLESERARVNGSAHR
jgi:chorismate synthase